jgi:hypothetical protein
MTIEELEVQLLALTAIEKAEAISIPRQVVQNLRSLGHDVQTVQEAGNAGLPDFTG